MNVKLTDYQPFADNCLSLGEVVINGVKAQTFVCGASVVAQFSDDPDDYVAAHLVKLSMTSNVFLLTAFRLYLDARGVTSKGAAVQGGGLESAPLQS